MVKRKFWINKIEKDWERRSVIWLAGVRRAGKTFLSRSLEKAEYFDCELVRVRNKVHDPEAFLKGVKGKRIVLDEIHRLENPSELLKIASDYFPETKVLATGSSSLQASRKFRDTLTGRKTEILLTPMMSADLEDFGREDIKYRLERGGLPPFFLPAEVMGNDFQEWIDSYWAKDVQELFRLERRHSFQKLMELLFVNSGGIFEANKYAGPCEISRMTVSNYLKVLESTWVFQVIKPFSSRSSNEIISAPKVYAFDTGFVRYYRGWRELRPEDLGILWEHLVLNEMMAYGQLRNVRFWRDKQGHEIDFVLVGPGKDPLAIECKWSSDNIDFRGLRAFRQRYEKGENWVIAGDVARPYSRKISGLEVDFVGIDHLAKRLGNKVS
jgi:predicted AAA+ superfamily ATPase